MKLPEALLLATTFAGSNANAEEPKSGPDQSVEITTVVEETQDLLAHCGELEGYHPFFDLENIWAMPLEDMIVCLNARTRQGWPIIHRPHVYDSVAARLRQAIDTREDGVLMPDHNLIDPWVANRVVLFFTNVDDSTTQMILHSCREHVLADSKPAKSADDCEGEYFWDGRNNLCVPKDYEACHDRTKRAIAEGTQFQVLPRSPKSE